MNFLEELRWRGLIHSITAGADEYLAGGMATGYIGFDPSSDSLHIGNLMQVMLLGHFQRAGNKPIALIGGATGMIGDPSGKTEERKLLAEEDIRKNENGVEKQLRKLLDFTCGDSAAEIVNNFNWTKNLSIFEILRDYGKHLPVNYMIDKDSVKNRLAEGISFTEFTYQLFQALDFYWLFRNKNCKIQLGGSDQWGNITTGIELIRRKLSKEAYGITSPLLLKPDGSKFGKTESGNVWLDRTKTSPYHFYQFWLNISDDEALKSIRIFIFKKREEILQLEEEHKRASEKRILQKEIAKELTTMVHSKDDYERSLSATEVLFGDKPIDALKNFSANDFENIFEGVPRYPVSRNALRNGLNVIDFLCVSTQILPSKNEVKRMLKGGGININKQKAGDESRMITNQDLVNDRYILVQKGKKNYFLVVAE